MNYHSDLTPVIEGEQWKDIPGYEHLYQASTLGRIRTCEGKVTSSKLYEHRVWKQRILKQKIQTRSYGRSDARVNLWKDGKDKTALVARLVAMTWCDGYSDELTVNHKNGVSLDNRACNLEWVSIGDNIRHAFRTGLMPYQKSIVVAIDNIEHTFNSFAECSRYLGRNTGYVSLNIKRQRQLYDKTGRLVEIRRLNA